jgi:hypothetical protein
MHRKTIILAALAISMAASVAVAETQVAPQNEAIKKPASSDPAPVAPTGTPVTTPPQASTQTPTQEAIRKPATSDPRP